jgi:uncharacterized protein (TIGR02598 family)
MSSPVPSPPPRLPTVARRQREHGFTLIEVAFAIAMAALGLVVLLGIIPQSLATFKTAADTAAEARIAQFIVGEMMLDDWENIESYHESRRYFDPEGIELAAASPDGAGGPRTPEHLAYTAKIEVLDPEGSIPSATHPAISEAQTLRRIQVHVTHVPLARFGFTEEERSRFRTYSSVVTKMDK